MSSSALQMNLQHAVNLEDSVLDFDGFKKSKSKMKNDIPKHNMQSMKFMSLTILWLSITKEQLKNQSSDCLYKIVGVLMGWFSSSSRMSSGRIRTNTKDKTLLRISLSVFMADGILLRKFVTHFFLVSDGKILSFSRWLVVFKSNK